MLDCTDNITSACLSFGPNHCSTFHNPPTGLTEIRASADEWNCEIIFRNMVEWIGRGQNLTFVDHVYSELLEDTSFFVMTDSSLGHHWYAGGIDDAPDEVRMAHSSHATIGSYVCGNSLKRHYSGSTCIFCNVCLLGSYDVHDDATLLHLGETPLEQLCAMPHLIEVY